MHRVEYTDNGKYAYFNDKRYCRDDNTGYYLHTLTKGTGSRLHRDVYEYYNGAIPKGMEIHHKDHDKSNNDIDNLVMLSVSEHRKTHELEISKERKQQRTDNWVNVCQEAAKEWHKSEEGKKWHKEHYENTKDKMHVERRINCKMCNKAFISTGANAEFCSNKCKAKHRRISGVDDIEKKCAYCGEIFKVSKYRKNAECCSRSCANRYRKVKKA